MADVNWLVKDEIEVEAFVHDPSGRVVDLRGALESRALIFVAAESGTYTVNLAFPKGTEVTGPVNIAIEYSNGLTMQPGVKQRDLRKVNGYDVKIVGSPQTETDGKSLVLIEKAGQLLRVF